jgi:hypothetical protein
MCVCMYVYMYWVNVSMWKAVGTMMPCGRGGGGMSEWIGQMDWLAGYPATGANSDNDTRH